MKLRSRTLANLARTRKPGGLPTVFLLTDERRLADPLPAAARLPRGVGVILRHYADPQRAILAARLATLCRRRGLLLLVANDARLARAVGAAGVHLPESAPRAMLSRRPRPGWLVTAAAHSLPALRRAARADAVLLSPVFTTASHPGTRPLGPVRFAALARHSPAPVYALGGITDRSLRRLSGTACGGAAAIGGLSGGRAIRSG